MDREAARQAVRMEWRTILADISQPARMKVNGEQSYICPICGNGSGESGDGITVNPKSKDRNSLKCFKCGFSGDIIALWMQYCQYGYNEALKELTDWYLHETIDEWKPDSTTTGQARGKDTTKTAESGAELAQNRFNAQDGINLPSKAEKPSQAKTDGTAGNLDFTEYFKECRKRLEDPRAISYLSARGISKETAAAYWIGFDPEFVSRAAADRAKESGKNPPPATARIIIPTSKGSYIARAIDQGARIRYMNEGSPGIFNKKALFAQEVKAVFIVEGAFDALSFLEAGFSAAALNSTSNVSSFIGILEKRKPKAKIIICMDGDEAGQKAASQLAAGLNRLNIPFTRADTAILDGHKDANEALTADRVRFVETIAAQKELAAKPDGVTMYIKTLMGGDMEKFRAEVKTGYANFDTVSGGLYPGLYVLGAISSLGKTTFAHQMADQMAAAGRDVIFFSLEQSRLELVSKSISRRTAQADITSAVTSLAVRKGCNFQSVRKAIHDYMVDVGNRLSIVEQNMDGGISYIANYIRNYINDNGETDAGRHPIIIIDYLQILQPEKTEGGRQSVRETVDSTVTALKRLSRELSITIIVISSFNRSNYLTPVDFESFKESGGIEYTADVVLGLQLQVLNDELFNTEKKLKEKRDAVRNAKKEDPRCVELVCLKNRYGTASFSCYFDYFPKFDLFAPGKAKPEGVEIKRNFSNARRV